MKIYTLNTFKVYWIKAVYIKTLKNDNINNGAHASFTFMVFSGYVHSSGIARSYGRFTPDF